MSGLGKLQDPRAGRRQYLVTYSQADAKKFPTRESFGEMLETEFNRGTSQVKVSRSKEEHQQSGFHYHCCIKLSGVKKWFSVKNSMTKRHDITVNFSDNHNHYIYAYRYVSKTDNNVSNSIGHPDLSDKVKMELQHIVKIVVKENLCQLTMPKASLKNKKAKRRLSNLDVSDYIVKHAIHNKTRRRS